MDLRKLKEKYLPTPSIIIDVGANIGQFFEECTSVYEDLIVYSYEPSSKAFEKLIQKNPNSYNKLLYKTNTIVPFYVRKGDEISTGNSIYRENTQFFSDDQIEVLQMETTTLDEECNELKEIDLLKLDTQGSELDILEGGQQTMLKSKYILTEVSNMEYNIGSPTENQVLEYMKEHNFKVVDILGKNYHPITRELIQFDYLFKNNLL